MSVHLTTVRERPARTAAGATRYRWVCSCGAGGHWTRDRGRALAGAIDHDVRHGGPR